MEPPIRKMPETDDTNCASQSCQLAHLRFVYGQPMRLDKGVSDVPKECSDVPFRRNAGSPKGRESYGDGAIIVVRSWESQLHPNSDDAGRIIRLAKDGR